MYNKINNNNTRLVKFKVRQCVVRKVTRILVTHSLKLPWVVSTTQRRGSIDHYRSFGLPTLDLGRNKGIDWVIDPTEIPE